MTRLFTISAILAVLASCADAASLSSPSSRLEKIQRRGASFSFVQGTYNHSDFATPISLERARAILPKSYAGRSDEDVFLNISTDAMGRKTTLAMLEVGRQEGNGPPGLPVLNNEETKLQLPYIKHLSNSTQSFIYKSQIFVDSLTAAVFGGLTFGLNDSVATMVPPNSANALNYDQETVGWFKIEHVTVGGEKKADKVDWDGIANMPWFTDGLLCGRHQYDQVKRLPLSGSVTLLPSVLKTPGSQPVVLKGASGVHTVAPFKIYGPAICSEFDTTRA